MLVNWSRIESFVSEESEEEMDWLKDMIKTLIENMDENLGKLEEFIKNKQELELKSLLHQIKGVAANFGLEQFQQHTLRAETLIKSGDLNSCLNESEQLPAIWSATKSELQKKFGSN